MTLTIRRYPRLNVCIAQGCGPSGALAGKPVPDGMARRSVHLSRLSDCGAHVPANQGSAHARHALNIRGAYRQPPLGPDRSLGGGRPAVSLAGDISDAFQADLFGVHAAGRNFTMIAGTECFRLAVPDQRNLAA